MYDRWEKEGGGEGKEERRGRRRRGRESMPSVHRLRAEGNWSGLSPRINLSHWVYFPGSLLTEPPGQLILLLVFTSNRYKPIAVDTLGKHSSTDPVLTAALLLLCSAGPCLSPGEYYSACLAKNNPFLGNNYQV